MPILTIFIDLNSQNSISDNIPCPNISLHRARQNPLKQKFQSTLREPCMQSRRAQELLVLCVEAGGGDRQGCPAVLQTCCRPPRALFSQPLGEATSRGGGGRGRQRALGEGAKNTPGGYRQEPATCRRRVMMGLMGFQVVVPDLCVRIMEPQGSQLFLLRKLSFFLWIQ